MIKYGATCLIKDTIEDLKKQFDSATADKKAAQKELNKAMAAYQQRKCQKSIKEYNSKNQK
jgi:hypothetical protein